MENNSWLAIRGVALAHLGGGGGGVFVAFC